MVQIIAQTKHVCTSKRIIKSYPKKDNRYGMKKSLQRDLSNKDSRGITKAQTDKLSPYAEKLSSKTSSIQNPGTDKLSSYEERLSSKGITKLWYLPETSKVKPSDKRYRMIISTGCNIWHILVYQNQTRDTKIEQLMQISKYKI